ncbi:hypothetical protein F0L68_14620 [Solihabitans fulvus]|uniref:Uncharacterized protein n=1 Tax=Solihabitans fulvus TaxID=1892852 RepID=A0A5B2XE13_9PSEU|nr:hypothetical protein [Solihabitans fulvus]KAA2261937.1 hypothetical protein F0L68_14620 [Solihabitans fulvus]
MEPPPVELLSVEPPLVGLRLVGLRLVEPPPVELPPIELPPVELPPVELPSVGLPLVEPRPEASRLVGRCPAEPWPTSAWGSGARADFPAAEPGR